MLWLSPRTAYFEFYDGNAYLLDYEDYEQAVGRINAVFGNIQPSLKQIVSTLGERRTLLTLPLAGWRSSRFQFRSTALLDFVHVKFAHPAGRNVGHAVQKVEI